MGWKLTATAITEDGVWTRTYGTKDGITDPEFARGFVCGAALAAGIPPAALDLVFEETDE